MPRERPRRFNRRTWISWSIFIAGLCAITGAQLFVDRDQLAEQGQAALNQDLESVVENYASTHSFGDPNKPTYEQFLKDFNGGQPLGPDHILHDPVSGGTVRVVPLPGGSFMPSPDFGSRMKSIDALSYIVQNLRDVFATLCGAAWVLIALPSLFAWTGHDSQADRIAWAKWLVCSSFCVTLMGILGTPPEDYTRLGFGFLIFSGLYLAATFIYNPKIDPTRRCAKCRYNLTGNESGVCPECGTRFRKARNLTTEIRENP
jgi:hypothetical protein